MSAAAFDLGDALAVLERTPAVLRALTAGLPAAWTTANEGPDTFTAAAVVGHLIGGEETDWIPRARIILAQGTEGAERRFAPFDRFAFRRFADRPLDELVERCAALRAENLTVLRAWKLGAAQLELQGEHPDFGTVTLAQLLATWVVHDLGHLAQIARVMAKRYRADVGPWRQYLPILDRK